jgi:hypothetical protein
VPWARAGDRQLLIQTRDFPSRVPGPPIDLAGGARGVVAPIAVGVGGAEFLAQEERARRELEDAVVALRRVGGISQPDRIDRIAKDLENAPVFRDNDDGVSLVGVDPDVPCHVQRDAVGSLEVRVRDQDVVGQSAGGVARPVVYRSPLASPVSPSMAKGVNSGDPPEPRTRPHTVAMTRVVFIVASFPAYGKEDRQAPSVGLGRRPRRVNAEATLLVPVKKGALDRLKTR